MTRHTRATTGWVFCLVTAGCLAGSSGCSQQVEPPEMVAAMSDLDSCLTEMTAILATVQDGQTAQEAAKKLETLQVRYRGAFQKVAAVVQATRATSAVDRGQTTAGKLDGSAADTLFEQQLARIQEVPDAGGHLAAFVKYNSQLRGEANDEPSEVAQDGEGEEGRTEEGRSAE